MPNITKHDLVADTSKDIKISQLDTKVLVEEFLNVVSDTLIEGRTVEIRGFGTFYVKERKGRIARNPKKPEQTVMLPTRKMPLFKFSRELKNKINLS